MSRTRRSVALRRSSVLVLGLMLGLAFAGCDESKAPAAPVTGIEVGNLAPAYSLTDAKGRSVTSESTRGKVVLLDISAVW